MDKIGLNKLLLKKYIGTNQSVKSSFLWNMIGSGIYAAGSLLLSLYVIRVLGADEGGIFSIAITVAQMLAFIEFYETRTYQVTDVSNKYSFADYKATKIILFIIATVVALVYAFFQGNKSSYKILVIVLMCVYRNIDGYADLYESTFQNDGRLDLAGKSQAFRTIFSVGIMAVAIVVLKNQVIACLLAIAAALIGLMIFDVNIMRMFRNCKARFDRVKIRGIIVDCFPLFCGSFLWSYILSASRIAVNTNMPSSFSSYYQTLFLPVSIINLFATFIMKPLLPKLADLYSSKDIRSYVQYILKIAVFILGLTVFCMAGAFLLGIPVLSALTGCDLSEYRMILVLVMFAGGINSLSFFGYYLLSVMRSALWIFGGYIVAAAFAMVSSTYLVVSGGLGGAAISFLLSVTLLLVIFSVGNIIGIVKISK